MSELKKSLPTRVTIEGVKFIKKVNANTGKVSYVEMDSKISSDLEKILAYRLKNNKAIQKEIIKKLDIIEPELVEVDKSRKAPNYKDDTLYKKQFTKKFEKILGKKREFWKDHTIEEAKELEPVYEKLLIHNAKNK